MKRSIQARSPFVALSRHKRRDAVVRMGWKIANQPEGYPFWTDHLLIDPQDPERIHNWVDVYFLGADRFTFWNAEIVTLRLREAEKANIPFLAALAGALRRCSSLVWLATRRSERLALHPASAPKNGISTISASLRRQEEVEGRSFKVAYAQLNEQEIAREFAIETVAVARTRPGQMRTRQWVQRPVQRYSQFEGRSFTEECLRLEANLLAFDPPEVTEGGRKSQYPICGRPCGRIAALLLACVARHTALRAPCTASRKRTQKRYIDYFRLPERFEIDPSYAYGIGLHAVVDEPTLDRAAIERCIERFRKLGKREWQSA